MLIDIRNIIYTRDYSKFSSNDFIDDVSIQTWNYDLDNPSDLFNDFYCRLEECVDRHAPIKKLKPKEIKMKTKPWITPELCHTIKTKNKLFERKKDNQQIIMSNFYITLIPEKVGHGLEKLILVNLT